MIKEKNKGPSVPEGELVKVIPMDPKVLLKNNFAAEVVDPEICRKMSGKLFSPERYAKQLTEVVRVIDPTTEVGYSHLPLDGHHRTIVIEEYQRIIDPNYIYLVSDVTDQIRVREGYKVTPGQTFALKVTQYWEEVGEPTKKHEAIASPRIAGHFLGEWRREVGDELAVRFPALSALTFLAFSPIRDHLDEDKIHRYLASYREPLVIDETPKEREHLEKNLIAMAHTIRGKRLKLDIEDVAFNATKLVSSWIDSPETDSAVQQKAHNANKQLEGLLLHPAVVSKLKSSVDDSSPTQRRNALSNLLKYTMATIEPAHIGSFYEAVMNRHLTYDHLITVLQPSGDNSRETITAKYNLVRQEINREKVIPLLGKEDLTEFEQALLSKLCLTAVMEPEQVQSVSTELDATFPIMGEIEQHLLRIQNKNGEVVDKLRKDLLDARKRLNSSVTHQGLKRARNGALEVLESIAGTIESIDTQIPTTVFEATTEQQAKEPNVSEKLFDPQPTFDALQRMTVAPAGKEKEMWIAIGEGIKRALSLPEAPVDLPKQEKPRELNLLTEESKVPEKKPELSKTTKDIQRIVEKNYKLVLDKIHYVQDGKGNEGWDAVDKTFSQRLARLAHELKWDVNKPEYIYLVGMFFKRALNIQQKNQTRPSEERDQLKKDSFHIKQQLDKYRDDGNLYNKTDPYTALLEFLVYSKPSVAMETCINALKQRPDDATIRGLVKLVTGREWVNFNVNAPEPQLSRGEAHKVFIDDRLIELVEHTVLGLSSTESKKKTVYDGNEGTLAWFQSEARENKDKVAELLDDAAKTVFKGHKEITDNWETLRSALICYNRDNISHGLDAIKAGIADNVITIVQKMGLDSKSPEFSLLAASFYWHMATLGRREASGLDNFVEAMYSSLESFKQVNKLASKEDSLKALLYAKLGETYPTEILQYLSTTPFAAEKANTALDRYTKQGNSIKNRFNAKILGID